MTTWQRAGVIRDTRSRRYRDRHFGGVRVSSRKERDRYVGRRRVPTPPRSRYTAVATTALLGAGVVALATAAAMPDLKSSDPGSLSGISNSHLAASRLDAAYKASRADSTRAAPAPNAALDVWRLP